MTASPSLLGGSVTSTSSGGLVKAIGVSLNLVKARVSEGNRGLTKPSEGKG